MRILAIGLTALFLSNLALAAEPRTLGVIVPVSKVDYEAKWGAQLRSWLLNCAHCKIGNFSPYNAKGDFEYSALPAHLAEAVAKSDLVYFGLNMRSNEKNLPLAQSLAQATKSGKLIVAPAGRPLDDGPSAPLAGTILAKLENLIIVGELNDRERLSPRSFFGPEMLTAVRPPLKELIGEGMAPAYFSTRLLAVLDKRNTTEWMTYLTEKKLKTKKIWADVEDFF